MFVLCLLFLFLCLTSIISVPMITYEMSRFDPYDTMSYLTTLDLLTSMDECACQCYENSMCLIGIYIEKNRGCSLFSARLSQGELRIVNDGISTVFYFPTKTTGHNSIIPPAIMEWSFDRNFNDAYNTWNGIFISSRADINQNSNKLWTSPGYAGFGSAVHFPLNSYYIIDHDFNLAIINFTVSVWFAVTFNFSTYIYDYFSFFSHCQKTYTRQCLHLVAGKDQFRFDFFDDSVIIGYQMNLYQWYHVAFVYDRSSSIRRIYVNGNLIRTRTTSGTYMGNATTIALGGMPLLSNSNNNSGYIDRVTFVSRVKTDSEILNEATLVAYYPFDGSYLDAGPNKIDNTIQVRTTFHSGGQVRQALLFDSSSMSYFQTNGFYYLGLTNYSYSFALWIYPFTTIGTILQVNASNGWSVPMIFFDWHGHLTAQTRGIAGLYAVSSNTTIPLMKWTHVSLTYSVKQGIRLFLNGTLVTNNSTYLDYSASGQMCTITIGYSFPTSVSIMDTSLSELDRYYGQVDELKIFSRELTIDEIGQLL